MALKRVLIAALLALAGAGNAGAQQYPSKPVRVVVPFAPGGGVDILIRAVAAELSSRWRQPVVIDNKAGAGTLIGADAVARAQPDGHTLLATIDPTVVANRFLYRSLPYDPDKSLVPVSLMVKSDQYLLANVALPANDLRELVAYAKRDKGKLSFGSYALGSQPHLVYEMLNRREKLDLLHVPYKGVAPVLTAVMSGEIQLTSASAGSAAGLMKDGRLKVLACAGKTRSSQFPGVPTVGEQGYPYLQATVWYALFAPAGTPAAITERISADVKAVLTDPSFAEKHATPKGLDVVASTPNELAERIREDVVSVGEMVRAAGVKPE